MTEFKPIKEGKVREIYSVDEEHLLILATDRISAFDHILDTEIPDKGRVLTAMSFFFFDAIDFPNHLAGPADDPRIPEAALGRAMVTKKLDMLPFECVARGYLTGSGLREYRKTGAVCGVELPAGLTEASKLTEPIFTPARKAELGDHDENVTFDAVVRDLGHDRAVQLREATLDIYRQAARLAEARGVILADTKFEFGLDESGQLVLADEVLTPDSSRYWPQEGYAAGKTQPSFDKQYVRDWLTGPDSGWNQASEEEPPALPGSVVEATRDRYVEAYELVSGKSFSAWVGTDSE